MTQDASPRDVALDWLVRTNDPEFDAWDEFTAWLEASPSNADEYHRVAANEAEMIPLIEAMPPVIVPMRNPERRRLALAAGVAILAAAGAAIVAPRLMPVDISTSPGETRIVSLGGQDQLVMNGDTKIKLAGLDRRNVRLEQGQVLLRLHDPQLGKIHLQSGDLQLVDVGTVFEVSRDGISSRVIVSEGAVVADPEGARLQLAAGQRLDTTDGATVLQALPADTASVGSFERGQLVYVDEPLDQVVADLRRSTGIDFSTSPAMSARRFSGTLSVTEVKRDPRALEPLLGVPMQRTADGWKLGGKV